ncbi:hypothetical protein M427DRAFT_195834 [Gonapodya prolifera JEL478]|uniref:Myosin-binding domain-containing protein n=1 Tax=Gonapodya prolifera (strain JEL478) TaxID=1344416 RepID=A0A139APC8_GONPJ|nr:hypothetical protein M427DRAFT_195834 [Gonapodya prolifera JEL478]|eukprot:KXS18611.1 hypothetical protein M427DRAFT_195834 [Gonapodya prolifera JEL478]
MVDGVVYAGSPHAELIGDADVDDDTPHEHGNARMPRVHRGVRSVWKVARKVKSLGKVVNAFKTHTRPIPLFSPPFLETVALTLEHFLIHLHSHPLSISIAWPAHLLSLSSSSSSSSPPPSSPSSPPPNSTHSVIDRLTSAMLKHGEVWLGPVALVAAPQIIVRLAKVWAARRKSPLRVIADTLLLSLVVASAMWAYRISKARVLSLQNRQTESAHLAALRAHLDASQRLDRAARRCIRAVAEVEAASWGFSHADPDEPSSPTSATASAADPDDAPLLCARLKRALHAALAQALLACAAARHETDDAAADVRAAVLALVGRDGEEEEADGVGDGEEEDPEPDFDQSTRTDAASPRPRPRTPSRPPSRDGTVHLDALRGQLDALARENLSLLAAVARLVRACRPLAEGGPGSGLEGGVRGEKGARNVEVLAKAWNKVSAAMREARRAEARAVVVVEDAEADEFRIAEHPLSASTSHLGTPVQATSSHASLASLSNGGVPAPRGTDRARRPLLRALAELDKEVATLRTKLYILAGRTGERGDGGSAGEAEGSGSVLHGPEGSWRAFLAAFEQVRSDAARLAAGFDDARAGVVEERLRWECGLGLTRAAAADAAETEGEFVKVEDDDGGLGVGKDGDGSVQARRVVRLWSEEDVDVENGEGNGEDRVEEVWEGEADVVSKSLLTRSERIALAAARRDEEARDRARREEAGRMLDELKSVLARRGAQSGGVGAEG